VLAHGWVGREIAISHERTDLQATIKRFFNHCQWQSADVHEMRWRFYPKLHQIEEVGTTGDKPRAWSGRHSQRRFANV
jgi:hypothetical protein